MPLRLRILYRLECFIPVCFIIISSECPARYRFTTLWSRFWRAVFLSLTERVTCCSLSSPRDCRIAIISLGIEAMRFRNSSGLGGANSSPFVSILSPFEINLTPFNRQRSMSNGSSLKLRNALPNPANTNSSPDIRLDSASFSFGRVCSWLPLSTNRVSKP